MTDFGVGWLVAERLRELEQSAEQSTREREQSFTAERAALQAKLIAAEQARSEELRRVESETQTKIADLTQVPETEHRNVFPF